MLNALTNDNNTGKRIFGLMVILIFLIVFSTTIAFAESGIVDAATQKSQALLQLTNNSIKPVVREIGKISLSIDGLGTNNTSGIIQVEKPARASVRKAFMAAASMGVSDRALINGDVKIDSNDVIWDTTKTTPCNTDKGLRCSNHWADVTSIVKSKIDAIPAGRVNFTITEVNTQEIDGEILAVIFDDPNQMTNNTIFLLFGAQNVSGDTFAITLDRAFSTIYTPSINFRKFFIFR